MIYKAHLCNLLFVNVKENKYMNKTFLIFLFIYFNLAQSAEDIVQNSNSYYQPGQEISIKNSTNKTFQIFFHGSKADVNSFFSNDRYFCEHNSEIIIELCKISDEYNYFSVLFQELPYLISDKIQIGAKYEICKKILGKYFLRRYY